MEVELQLPEFGSWALYFDSQLPTSGRPNVVTPKRALRIIRRIVSPRAYQRSEILHSKTRVRFIDRARRFAGTLTPRRRFRAKARANQKLKIATPRRRLRIIARTYPPSNVVARVGGFVPQLACVRARLFSTQGGGLVPQLARIGARILPRHGGSSASQLARIRPRRFPP